jgi:hypothetical protein
MTIRAKYAGTCSVCGKRINVGEEIEWDKDTRTVAHPECASALKEPAPYEIHGGSGYGCRGWRNGQIVRAGESLRKNGYPEWLYVVRTKREYCPEDGMSFGVGSETGYIHYAWCREATAEEAAPEIERRRKADEKAAAKKRIDELKEMIRNNGEKPEKSETNAHGEVMFDTFDFLGGGDRFVVASDGIWYVQNNGADGDDWSANNVHTLRGAGAIGWRVSFDQALVDELRKLSEIIPDPHC